MLNDIDAVPWGTLRHAFGEASDVPKWIRALASSDRNERQAALKELFACLLHQGTVYDATALAVPFLFELLSSSSTPDRNWVAFLVASIADGKGYLSGLTADEIRGRVRAGRSWASIRPRSSRCAASRRPRTSKCGLPT